MATRVYTLTLTVRAPHTTGENEISQAINAALDEPPCDWGGWQVGAALVSAVTVEETDD